MSQQHAKTVVATVAAVLLAGVQAWQTVIAGGPFRLVDALPIAIAVVGAVLVHVIPNVPGQPVAKGIIAGLLAALNAASSVLIGAPANVTALNLTVAVLGALLTWYVPNLAPELAVAQAATDLAAGRGSTADLTGALTALEQLDPTVAAATPLAPVAGPPTAEIPAQLPRPATPAALAAEPTPVYDAAVTDRLPAIPVG